MKVFIIEDEPLLAESLRDELLAADTEVQIVAMTGGIRETLDVVHKQGLPDLFFSDIELSDGLSFEIFHRLNSGTPVIFCTAYNHYALDAFRANGIDYILKPFGTDDIKRTLRKYKSLSGNSSPNRVFQQLIQKLQSRPTSLLVHRGESIIPLPINDIAMAVLQNEIVYVHTFGGKKYALTQNLEEIGQLVGGDLFRVNRQTLIHRKAVGQVSRYFARKLLIHPTIPYSNKLLVSKANTGAFLQWLENYPG